MDQLDFQNTFPGTITVPRELVQLRTWLEQHGYPISGGFELCSDEKHGAIYHWFGTESVLNRLAMFGVGPDGSPYAIWLQDDGQTPIVHMGSEGQNNFVLAGNFVQFLRLLAIGYGELGFDDLSQPPRDDPNPGFQKWVTETFSVEIPSTGSKVVQAARERHQDFEAWIQHVLNTVKPS